MIDFFHQRNNNFNGFNSQDEQVRQNSFQKQYQYQEPGRGVEEQRDLQGPGGSGGMQKLKPRRNAG
jgi:predicted NUDIX family phosphoesterase